MSKLMTLEDASEALRLAVQDTVARNPNTFLVQAALLVVAGAGAILTPLFTSHSLATLLGIVLIGTAVAQAVALLGSAKIPHYWPQAVSAALAGTIGLILIVRASADVRLLTLLFVVFFMMEGVAKAIFALTIRPMPGWNLLLLAGLLAGAIALALLAAGSASGLVLGIAVGVQLIAEGLAIGMLVRRTRAPQAPGAAPPRPAH